MRHQLDVKCNMNLISRQSVALVLAVVLTASPTATPPTAQASMLGEVPTIFNEVFHTVGKMLVKCSYKQGTTWPKYSEEWYWEELLAVKPFRSVYADEGLQQPLIDSITINLSQTPREQCEREGIVIEGLERDGPGQVSSTAITAVASQDSVRFCLVALLCWCIRCQPGVQQYAWPQHSPAKAVLIMLMCYLCLLLPLPCLPCYCCIRRRRYTG
jgi:hypothetical protein